MAQLGMVGIGRMGTRIVRRLMRDGHDCVVYDVSADAVAELEREGATGTTTLDDFVQALDKPRAAWVMIPAAITGEVVDRLAELVEPGDVIIDGGNSYYRDDIARAASCGRPGSTTSTAARAAACSASSAASAS
jgi:6-phosphogluconate dehydrogenase